MRLPGLVADALPDGWGLMLMDRLFRKAGRPSSGFSPLDRLAFIGTRAMGALTFEPADPLALSGEDVQLLELAQQAQAVIADKNTEALKALALMGGSPHGARPKVLVFHDSQTGHMSNQPFAGAGAWLVKFQAQAEHKEVCAIENLYADLARAFGLDMPATLYFDLDKKLAGFGIERFDVERGMRVPVHTLAGLLHANFRLPSAVDYGTFLRATRFLTRNQVEVNKAYERAVFNVVFTLGIGLNSIQKRPARGHRRVRSMAPAGGRPGVQPGPSAVSCCVLGSRSSWGHGCGSTAARDWARQGGANRRRPRACRPCVDGVRSTPLRPGSPSPPERTHAVGGLGASRDRRARRENSWASRPKTHHPSKKHLGRRRFAPAQPGSEYSRFVGRRDGNAADSPPGTRAAS